MTPTELAALRTSALIACLAVTLCTPLAVALANWTNRVQGRSGVWLSTVLLAPMVLSPAIVGLGLAGLLSHRAPVGAWAASLPGGTAEWMPTGLTLAACVLTLPLMVRALRPAFAVQDPMRVPVARTLGASAWQAWWTVTLPAAWPAVVSAMALGWAAAWGETGAAIVLVTRLPQGAGDLPLSVPLALASEMGPADSPLGNRLAWVALAVAVLATLVSEWSRARWQRLGREASAAWNAHHG